MRVGNLIAGLLMLPLALIFGMIILQAGSDKPDYNGLARDYSRISIYAFISGMIYLLINNRSYLKNTRLIKWIEAHRNILKIAALVLGLTVVLLRYLLSKL